jgi:hypothetical protein
MRKSAMAFAGVLAMVGVVGLGFAVSGLASSGGAVGAGAGTSEATTGTTESTTESTTEGPVKTAWRATLTGGQEIPKPKGVRVGAGGTFDLTLTEDDGAYSVEFKLVLRRLTGRAMAAHIHRGKPGRTGPVLIALCGPCTSGKQGRASIPKAVVTAMESGAAYVNVHTAKNPTGEIRGQIKKKP